MPRNTPAPKNTIKKRARINLTQRDQHVPEYETRPLTRLQTESDDDGKRNHAGHEGDNWIQNRNGDRRRHDVVPASCLQPQLFFPTSKNSFIRSSFRSFQLQKVFIDLFGGFCPKRSDELNFLNS